MKKLKFVKIIMIQYCLKRCDFFEKELPKFRLKGKEKVASIQGGVLSIVMISMMLWYAAIKFNMLMLRDNPNVSTFTEESVLTSLDKLNLKESGMLLAWTWEGYSDR